VETTFLSEKPRVRDIQTPRLRMRVRSCGDENAKPIIFIHGNFSSSLYFEHLMLALPPHIHSIAVDLRGYGDTEDKIIDATRGAKDWADDLAALCKTLNIESAHWVGWSAGSGAILQLLLDTPALADSLTLIAPVSPYGFGGTRDLMGTPCHEDYAGSGGGTVPAEFIENIAQQDRGTKSPLSPRNVIQQSFFYQTPAEPLVDEFLSASLAQNLGPDRYPGDSSNSPHWPHTSPGQYGPLNAISARYFNVEAIANLPDKPPILWVRGDQDIIISNQSLSDFGVLGQMGLVDGWPGTETYPAQPMVDQTRQVLQKYSKLGGSVQEEVMKDTGHSPFIEDQEAFLKIFVPFIEGSD